MTDLADIDWTEFDFIDFGAGTGGSLANAQKRTGGRGVGVELRESKVQRARAEGLAVHQGSIFDIPVEKAVDFVTIDNVLEHLPTMDDVRAALDAAARVATDFIYVRHPSFDDECYLNALGLKQFWTDWTDHPSHIQVADFMRWSRDMGAASWMIHPVLAAASSDDTTILPIDAPPDQHHYDQAQHGSKPSVAFGRPVYYAWDIVITLDPAVSVEMKYLHDPETDSRRPRLVRNRIG